ncbi:hypothetical protein HN903_00550 [archaeon]|jgi:hypothetical protein|nr:hypothetical protein [archaeon]MBT7128223.1 hypothetical protein [archaeon]MBT7484140.1 hypothetical protein [Candidatus Peregrinibacteria bacterium]
MDDRLEKIRASEKKIKLELIDEGWAPVDKKEFGGYLFKMIDGEKNIYAPDGMGGYYVRYRFFVKT